MPPDLSSPPRDELVMKVLVALYVPGTDVHEVIQAHRRYLVELMQEWTRIKEDDAGSDLSMSPGGRLRAVPARLGCPLAGRGRGPGQRAAADGAMTWADQATPRDQTERRCPGTGGK